ncbi:MAG: MFS transporter [Acidiferrobacter sp.]
MNQSPGCTGTLDSAPPTREKKPIALGSPAFRRVNIALFGAGLSTFSTLYCVQPLMPLFSRHYGVSPADSALSLSLTTGVLAVAMLFAGTLADRFGRKPVMTASLLLSALLVLATGLAPDWSVLLLMRALLGITLSGVPAVAMAYINEELDTDAVGLGMGLYIGGSAVGGMSGRLLSGVLASLWGWRAALAVVGLGALVATALFWRSLPPSRHFEPRHVPLRSALMSLRAPFRDMGLRWLFAEGFLLMGIFVTYYDYLGYRLMAAPYRFNEATVGLLFSVYLVGIFSSSWMGHKAGRIGRRKVFWTAPALLLFGILLSFCAQVPLILLSLTALTFAFFGGHSIASSWVGRRAQAKTQAASLYLFFYYLGSAFISACGGVFYARWGWNGVAGLLTVLGTAGLIIAWRLRRLVPIQTLAPLKAIVAPPDGSPQG